MFNDNPDILYLINKEKITIALKSNQSGEDVSPEGLELIKQILEKCSLEVKSKLLNNIFEQSEYLFIKIFQNCISHEDQNTLYDIFKGNQNIIYSFEKEKINRKFSTLDHLSDKDRKT
jgi:hypothetical protein